MFQLARHCIERYGREEVSSWYWELWNEPDIAYWRGTVEQYCALYDHTVAGLSRALGEIKVGGPAVTGGERATRFMDAFLAHCAGEGGGATNAVTGERGATWTSSPSTPKAPPSARATTPSRTTGPSSPGAATARGGGGWRCHGCHPRGRRC